MITDPRTGVDWLTATEAKEQIHPRLSTGLLRRWRHRHGLPSAVIGGKAHYPRPAVVELEWLTSSRTRGGSLDGDHLGVAS